MDKTTFWSHTAPSYESIEKHSDFEDYVPENHDHDGYAYSLSTEQGLASSHIAEQPEQHGNYTVVEIELIEVRVFSTVRIKSENTYDKFESFFKKKR